MTRHYKYKSNFNTDFPEISLDLINSIFLTNFKICSAIEKDHNEVANCIIDIKWHNKN